jgi:hypothetical protein
MLQAQSAVWTAENARALTDRYRRVLGIVLLVEIGAGLLFLAWPQRLAEFLDMPAGGSGTWARLWAAVLIVTAALGYGGRAHPADRRWPNWIGIAARLGLTCLCFVLAGGAVWLGLWFGLATAALLVTYWRASQAELMAKP